MHSEGNLDKILHDIENAPANQRKDKFTKKYGLVVCNEKYDDRAALPNLHETKNDFNGIKRITNMMDIKAEDMTELLDVSHRDLD